MLTQSTCAVCGAPFTRIQQIRSHVCRQHPRYGDVAARFWSKVDQSGGPDACWPWMGCRSAGGYGGFSIGQTRYGAHRMAWQFTHGPIPDGLLACHKCDNPPCCNPAHLFLGTYLDNAHDRDVKSGRRNGRELPEPSQPVSPFSLDFKQRPWDWRDD